MRKHRWILPVSAVCFAITIRFFEYGINEQTLVVGAITAITAIPITLYLEYVC